MASPFPQPGLTFACELDPARLAALFADSLVTGDLLAHVGNSAGDTPNRVIDRHRMVTVAKWRDGAIAEEYIWM